MLLSESAATALYGKHWLDADVVGKQLFLDDRIPFTITGVFSDLDKLSHFRISLLATVPSELSAWMNGSSEVYTYLLRAEHAKSDLMREKVRNFDSPVQEDFSALAFDIQKLRDVHLTSDLEDEMADTDELSNLYSMCILIALIAFIAATNYASLYAANVLDRLKEVGVRKSIGATSSNVRSQFVFEVATTAIIALVISVIVLTSIACSGGICHSPV